MNRGTASSASRKMRWKRAIAVASASGISGAVVMLGSSERGEVRLLLGRYNRGVGYGVDSHELSASPASAQQVSEPSSPKALSLESPSFTNSVSGPGSP